MCQHVKLPLTSTYPCQNTAIPFTEHREINSCKVHTNICNNLLQALGLLPLGKMSFSPIVKRADKYVKISIALISITDCCTF